MNLKKAILNRKIKAHNIEAHLQTLLTPMSPQAQNLLINGNTTDVYKSYFVSNNKPISQLPADRNNHLSFKIKKTQDSNILSPNMVDMHRRSMTDLKSPIINSKNKCFSNSFLEVKLPLVKTKFNGRSSMTNFKPHFGKHQLI